MGASSSSSDDDLISGINVTPLVDVVLVLLVIFMITAPVIYQSALTVELPKAKTGEDAQSKSPLNFTLTKEGTINWNSETLGWEQLEKKLKDMGQRAAQETAIISADQATPHGTVIRLMDTLRQVGLTRFSLNVDNRR